MPRLSFERVASFVTKTPDGLSEETHVNRTISDKEPGTLSYTAVASRIGGNKPRRLARMRVGFGEDSREIEELADVRGEEETELEPSDRRLAAMLAHAAFFADSIGENPTVTARIDPKQRTLYETTFGMRRDPLSYIMPERTVMRAQAREVVGWSEDVLRETETARTDLQNHSKSGDIADRLDLREIDMTRLTIEEQIEVATRVQELLYGDFRRVGASEDEARSVADPDNDTSVNMQWQKLLDPRAGTEYFGLYDEGDSIELGIVKVGVWLPGDARPFGWTQQLRAKAEGIVLPHDRQPRGLHAFSVEEGLAKAGLAMVRRQAIPAAASLRVVAHENDEELHTALGELGANDHRRSGVVTLGKYAANYRLFTLDPIS